MSGVPSGQTSFGSREVASGAPEGWRWAVHVTLCQMDATPDIVQSHILGGGKYTHARWMFTGQAKKRQAILER